MSFVISSSRAISRIENPTLCTISQPYNKNLLLKVNPQPGNRGNQEILFSWRLRIGIITGRNEVMAKVMFLLVSVILLTGGGVCLSACWDTTPPLGADTPGSRHPPEQTPPEQTPPIPGSRPPQEQSPAYGQWAAGTHPTGMHSGLVLGFRGKKNNLKNPTNLRKQDIEYPARDRKR